MKVAHVALWTSDMDSAAAFWTRYFNAKIGPIYYSQRRPGFVSRFVELPGGGAKIELMAGPWVGPGDAGGLDQQDSARVGLGGFLHDLGKIAVTDAILRKTGKLTDEEYAVIKTHPSVGARMLAGHPLGHLVEDAVLLHHERPDGFGYPFGRTSANLPDMATIVGVCDAFDAMTSHRPYRAGMPIEKAMSIISGEAGRQFDARFSGALAELAKDGALDHIAGHSDEGIPLQSCPNCGPTLALARDSRPGKLIYCRNCSGQFKLASDGDKLVAEPTGKMGAPNDLMPELDHDLIKHTIREAVAALPLGITA